MSDAHNRSGQPPAAKTAADDSLSLADLTPTQLKRCDHWADEFETRWRRDPNYRIEDFLLQMPPQEAALYLPELITVEVDLRHSLGDVLQPADYARRFPLQRAAVHRAFARLDKSGTIESPKPSGDSTDFEVDEEVPPTIPEHWGGFRIAGLLGSGSFGDVYRATACESGEVVALKFPAAAVLGSERRMTRFLDEAIHAQRLEHPRIVQTRGIVRDKGLVAIVQQYIDGTDLKSQLKQPRTHLEVVRLIEALADALAYAHHRGIYHRDLKPSNILIDRQGQPFIADFGLALDERQQMSMPKQFCGTLSYMSPEQVAGLTRLLDGRSDIWSLGVIFYELLTGRRPFAGESTAQIREQIESKDPRPLRQCDPTIDKELQRICLKCLARQQRDRYPTADELADDLRQWAANPTAARQSDPRAAAIVPKGLRSYSAEDATFFLQLLPGPRDRFGLPASLRFWLSRIDEPVIPENRVPVGVLFGPSGSGKSSFVKAGLLPRLDRSVLSIFVESTQADQAAAATDGTPPAHTDTELRLMKALRQRLPQVPPDISPAELLHAIAAGEYLPTGYDKVLLVLDQFEQRLSQPGAYDDSQLARALRYCDGERLQCLLLVRDDFMMSLARFADVLDMDLREGGNAQAIDLFDRRHARFVLTELGRAYHCLPPESESLTREHEEFLEQAVAQLAEHEQIICVRLALFAEMFRYLPWTPAELQRMGGVAGTGERYLAATFGAESRNPLHQELREPAQRVLERLLPDPGTNIRGVIRNAQDLQAAAQLAAPQQFDQLLEVLDTELRLITRTDRYPAASNGTPAAESATGAAWYQLTHDYLVPSIRGWLDTSWKTTRAGRAKIRLRELAGQVVPGQPPRNLPTNWEFVAWQFLLPARQRQPQEQLVMAAARRRFLRQTGTALAIGLVIFAVGGYWYLNQRAKSLIDNLLGQEIAAVPSIVSQIAANTTFTRPKLQALARDSKKTQDERLRLAMGLFPTEPSQENILLDGILQPDCPPPTLAAVVQVLARTGRPSYPQLVAALDDSTADPRVRFRAACAEILLGNAERQWSNDAELIATVLWNEPLTYLDGWIKILQTQGGQFIAKFDEMIRKPDDPDSQYVLEADKALALAEANYSFKPAAERWTSLAGLIPAANEVRFNAILATIEKHQTGDQMAAALRQLNLAADDAAGQANQALALARLGHAESLLAVYRGDFTSLPTFLAINFATAGRIRLQDLQELYERQGLDQTEAAADPSAVNLRRAVLQALALQTGKWLELQQRTWLAARARHHLLTDPDACCYSTAELILRRLESDEVAALRMERRQRKQSDLDAPYGNVMINHLGRPFSIVHIPASQEGTAQVLAVSTCEVTFGELDDYRTAIGQPPLFRDKNPDMPLHNYRIDRGLILVLSYCNWLNNDPAWLNNARFYADPVTGDGIYDATYDPANPGYRLATTAEWKAFSQSNRVMEGLQQLWPRPATNYAWTFENSQHSPHEVGHLLPNAAGLLDTFANVDEICHTLRPGSEMLQSIGYTWRAGSNALKVDNGSPSFIAVVDPQELISGYRIVRTMRPN